MITEYDIYWITRLDSIRSLIAALAFISCFSVIGIVCYIREGMNYKRLMNKLLYIGVPVCCCLTLLFSISVTLIPTTKEMCVIKVIPRIVNNENIHNVGNAAYNVAIEWLNELKPSKSK